ncbi:Lon protease family protein [Syntrophomonas erecta]
MDIRKYRVKTRDLCKNCNPAVFKFCTTAEIKPLKGIIGQDRAVRSLAFGLDIDNPGYNIYLAGAFGTGKTTLARELLQEKASQEPVPPDWCYVYNFDNPDCPAALSLPAGMGRQFKKHLAGQVEKVVKNIIKALDSEEFDFKRNEILTYFTEETNRLYLHAEEQARSLGFAISRSEKGINSVPMKNGEALSQEDYMNLSEEDRADLMKNSVMVQEKLNEVFRHYKDLEKVIREKIRSLEQETARLVAAPFFAVLFDRYRDYEAVVRYLESLQQDLLEHIELFVRKDENSLPLSWFRHMDKRSLMRRYQVNLLVDNSELDHAPVTIETNPTFSNLFGQIEYESEFGILATDFSKIKSGSVHRANGGYLVLHMYDLMKNFYVWDTLKRVLKNGEICVESVSRMFGISNSETLQPQPIPVKVKVIIIGEPIYYYLLYTHDEEFQKLFKIKADFDTDMERSRKHVHEYACFIASVCESEKLRHFDPQAVAQVVDYGSRMAEHQGKLTTLFNRLVEIIYEANYLAGRENSPLVKGVHVQKALVEKRYRSSMVEDHIQEYIEQQTLMIDIDSFKVGEINGLAVYEMGDHSFGKPVRITAKTFMGESGLVNIEREIRLSGRIHSKGILTLNGYLGAQYAQDKPLSLSASLTFEQSYQGIEGDSASSAELYALLSSLSGVPIYQGIAVTGSVNQNGEIQPVGGVNQKVEGFFRVCERLGLNGKQGVVIPRQNVKNLMLHKEVVEAVKKRRFNIWAVEHIDEGLEILTGVAAGTTDEWGRFPPDTIHGRADKKLSDWSSKRRLNRDGQRNRTTTVKKRRRG